MSDEQNVLEGEPITTIKPNETMANPFSDESWANEPVKVEDKKEIAETKKTKEEKNDSPVNPFDSFKEKYGYQTPEDAFKEIDELRTLKENSTTKEEIKFANEQSKKFFELLKDDKEEDVYKFLDEKRKIDKITSTEVNKDNAAETIKLGMQLKFKDLTPEEIDYKYNKQFAIPKKPVQVDTELEAEFEERMDEWKAKVADVEKEKIIEAKLARPELDKFKSELKLPDIQEKEIQPKQPTQEELDANKKYVDQFLESSSNAIKSFEGFNVSVKDKDVDIPIAYIPSEDEKKAVANQLKDFAEKGFNANAIFADRWINKDNSLNVQQMVKDWFLLQNEGKIAQKYANDAASKRLELHIKAQHNTDLKEQPNKGTFNPDNNKSEMDKLAAVMFAK